MKQLRRIKFKVSKINYKELYFELVKIRGDYIIWLDKELKKYSDMFKKIRKNEPDNQIGSTAVSQAMFALQDAKNKFLEKEDN